jgi:hypothetical protein
MGRDIYTDTHRQQGDVISIVFFEHKESRMEKVAVILLAFACLC